MIKRRFYRQEHGEKDGASSDSSSSSSDSDLDAQTSADSDAETQPQPQPCSHVEAHDDDDDELPLQKAQLPSSSSSGYESEDSSDNEIDAEAAGLITNADDSENERDGEHIKSPVSREGNDRIVDKLENDLPVEDDVPQCVLRCKSVFKCRLCPKIVCLNMESLKTHLQSKRHSRSEKLLSSGRLKRILNSDGEEEILSEDDGETHAERHARIVALAQSEPKKNNSGRQRQRKRSKRKIQKNSHDTPKSGQQKENRAKRRKKNVD